MSIAYVDTSVLTASVFDEPGAATYAQRLDEFVCLISSNLLEAELRAAFAREKLLFQEGAIAGIEWILPTIERLLPSSLQCSKQATYGVPTSGMSRQPSMSPPNPAASRSSRSTPGKAPLRRRSVFRFCGKRGRHE